MSDNPSIDPTLPEDVREMIEKDVQGAGGSTQKGVDDASTNSGLGAAGAADEVEEHIRKAAEGAGGDTQAPPPSN